MRYALILLTKWYSYKMRLSKQFTSQPKRDSLKKYAQSKSMHLFYLQTKINLFILPRWKIELWKLLLKEQ